MFALRTPRRLLRRFLPVRRFLPLRPHIRREGRDAILRHWVIVIHPPCGPKRRVELVGARHVDQQHHPPLLHRQLKQPRGLASQLVPPLAPHILDLTRALVGTQVADPVMRSGQRHAVPERYDLVRHVRHHVHLTGVHGDVWAEARIVEIGLEGQAAVRHPLRRRGLATRIYPPLTFAEGGARGDGI